MAALFDGGSEANVSMYIYACSWKGQKGQTDHCLTD